MKDFMAELRAQFDSFEAKGKGMSPSVELSEAEPDCRLSLEGQQKSAIGVFTVVIDTLIAELNRRYESYKELRNSSALNLQRK